MARLCGIESSFARKPRVSCQPWVGPTIKDNILTRQVACVSTAKERSESAKLFRHAKTALWNQAAHAKRLILEHIGIDRADPVLARHIPKIAGRGPPALLTRISGVGQAASTSSRPSSVVMSAAIGITSTSVPARMCSDAALSASWPRALITRSTPSRAVRQRIHAREDAHPDAQDCADLPQ